MNGTQTNTIYFNKLKRHGDALVQWARSWDKLAFTLVELLISVFIISILILITLCYLRGVKERAHRTSCSINLRSIYTGLEMYGNEHHDFYPYCAGYEPPKPCPENLLLRENYCVRKHFFCPKDKPNTYAETEELFEGGGMWAGKVFWPNADDGEKKYVRYMHDFDRRDGTFSIEGMESSYMWNEFIASRETPRNSGKPRTLGIVADGGHVVNCWEWGSLSRERDSRRDQTHLWEGKEAVNMLYGNGEVEPITLDEVGNVRSDPDN